MVVSQSNQVRVGHWYGSKELLFSKEMDGHNHGWQCEIMMVASMNVSVIFCVANLTVSAIAFFLSFFFTNLNVSVRFLDEVERVGHHVHSPLCHLIYSVYPMEWIATCS